MQKKHKMGQCLWVGSQKITPRGGTSLGGVTLGQVRLHYSPREVPLKWCNFPDLRGSNAIFGEVVVKHFSRTYNEKTTENYRNGYVAEKRIAYKLSKISIKKFEQHKFKTLVKIVSKFHVLFFYTFRQISLQRALLSDWADSSF